MANVCAIRHQGYIKSKVQFPYRHNLRKGKNYRNENIKADLSSRNTIMQKVRFTSVHLLRKQKNLEFI